MCSPHIRVLRPDVTHMDKYAFWHCGDDYCSMYLKLPAAACCPAMLLLEAACGRLSGGRRPAIR